MKVDDALTYEWQTAEDLMKKTKSGKAPVVSRLNKLFNNWQVIEKMRKNGVIYYKLIKK